MPSTAAGLDSTDMVYASWAWTCAAMAATMKVKKSLMVEFLDHPIYGKTTFRCLELLGSEPFDLQIVDPA